MLARPKFPFSICTLDEASDLFAERSAARGLQFDRQYFQEEVTSLWAAVTNETNSTRPMSAHSDVPPKPPAEDERRSPFSR